MHDRLPILVLHVEDDFRPSFHIVRNTVLTGHIKNVDHIQ